MRMTIIGAIAFAALGAAAVQSPALAAEARTVRAPTVGCFDRAIMRQAHELRDDDRGFEASAMIQGALAAGFCRRVAPGMLVRVDDDDILAGLSKVRAGNGAAPIWVRTDALSDD